MNEHLGKGADEWFVGVGLSASLQSKGGSNRKRLLNWTREDEEETFLIRSNDRFINIVEFPVQLMRGIPPNKCL